MMGWKKDFVMVLHRRGGWRRCEVYWACGRAYAEGSTEIWRLLPGGKFDDAASLGDWLVKWEPASAAMQRFYTSEPEGGFWQSSSVAR